MLAYLNAFRDKRPSPLEGTQDPIPSVVYQNTNHDNLPNTDRPIAKMQDC